MQTVLRSSRSWWPTLFIPAITALVWLSPPGATAASRQWLGGGVNQLWNTATNWVGSIAPTNFDSAVFPPAATQKATVYNLPVTNMGLITFQGSNYSVTGSTIPVGAGINSSPLGGTNAVATVVQLVADQTFNSVNAGAMLVFTAVAVTNQDLILTGSGDILTGPLINGTGTVSKLGNGTWIATGTNTYKGATRILDGTNALRNADFTNSASFVVSNATLIGTGRVSALTLRFRGVIDPGDPVGRITVAGNYTAPEIGVTNRFDLTR